MSLNEGLICILCCDDRHKHMTVRITAMADPKRHPIKFSIVGTNLPPGKHGFHVHTTGNLQKGCESLGAHYNPTNALHGDLNDPDAHYGDLGNLTVDRYGNCNQVLYSNLLKLSELVGRSLVFHSNPDDLGRGENVESLKTGNSGARFCCGVIGWA
jgi:superoxide dismutase, Cu-Zn family